MLTSKLIEGLKILSEYRDKDGYDVGAEHDIIYAYATTEPVSEDDFKSLIELGWFQEGKSDEPTYKEYDRDESWCAFT